MRIFLFGGLVMIAAGIFGVVIFLSDIPVSIQASMLFTSAVFIAAGGILVGYSIIFLDKKKE